MGRVLLAAPRGYCAGVERAIVTVEQALRQHGPPVYVRKQIVHNTFVVADLTRRGAVFVDELAEVPTGSLVILSAHGVAPSVHAEAAERRLRVIDAVCPLVTKVHREAQKLAADGYEIALIGHAGHEETVGTVGQAPGRVHLIDPEDLSDGGFVPNENGKVAWLSQTTLAVNDVTAAVERLRHRFPDLAGPPSDDICYASQNRQEAVIAIAADCDLVLVVGSANSSNSLRLVDVALAHGAPAAYLVDDASQIDRSWFAKVATVGVTSGASVPETLVQQVLEWLSGNGFAEVSLITTREEHLTFALPPEVRDRRGVKVKPPVPEG
jgi:4-hydroxy-3-methylbut-2-enyl diphosphate reductase